MLDRAADRNERVYALGRASACALLLLRTYFAAPRLGAPAAVHLAGLALAITFSWWELRTEGLLPRSVLTASAALDVALAFAWLLGEELWPDSRYHGLLNQPDVALLCVVACSSGLRLWRSIVFITLMLDAVSAFALLVIDFRLDAAHRSYGVEATAPFAMVLLLASAFACVLASRMRLVVPGASPESALAPGARRAVETVLRDHHGFRSLLCAAQLDADLLHRDLCLGHTGPAAARHAQALREDLRELAFHCVGVRERAYRELAGLDRTAIAELRPAVDAAGTTVLRRFGLRLEQGAGVDAHVLMLGGQRGLQTALVDLLVNAGEGDAGQGATVVCVSCSAAPGNRVRVEIRDDGPGFPARVLNGDGSPTASAKPLSSGLGLWLVRTQVEASGGRMVLDNDPDGGAVVYLELPRAP